MKVKEAVENDNAEIRVLVEENDAYHIEITIYPILKYATSQLPGKLVEYYDENFDLEVLERLRMAEEREGNR